MSGHRLAGGAGHHETFLIRSYPGSLAHGGRVPGPVFSSLCRWRLPGTSGVTPWSAPSWNACCVGTSPDAGRSLFVAVDVHYLDDSRARAAVVASVDRRFAVIAYTSTAAVAVTAAYVPGQFYRRELPALQAVIPRSGRLALIVVDGYVDLDAAGRPGLGAYVHAEFEVPVIGVAKTPFRTATHAAHVFRGRSGRPLYVTAAGMPIADAAHLVDEMAGPFRVPDGLRLADRLARDLELPQPGER